QLALIAVVVTGALTAWQQQKYRLMFYRYFRVYYDAGKSLQAKVESLRWAEAENYKLRLENAHLRLSIASNQFQCHAESSADETGKVREKIMRLTGSKIGRTLAAIPYQIPNHVTPEQLYMLGVSYFK